MNLGLGNLIELKRQLLSAGQLAEATYDTLITGIGQGVAGMFDQFCNRAFERKVAEVEEFSADRRYWCLRRFPLESITAVEQRDDMVGGWVGLVINDVIVQRDDKAGLIKFGAMQGTHLSQVRIEYTGGYWFDTTEDGSGVKPGGATDLPKDVKLAWYLQCREVWNKIDRVGLALLKGEGDKTFVAQMLQGLEMVPAVKDTLNTYRRFA